MACAECFTGHIKSSKPKGEVRELHGRNTYIASPDGSAYPKGIVVIVPDAFGWKFVNNRLLADQYASRGQFKVYLPDFMDGTAAPLWMMDVFSQVTKKKKTWADMLRLPYYVARSMYGFVPFIVRNTFSTSMVKVQSFLEGIRTSEEGHLPLGVAGFCWGGLHGVKLANGIAASNGKPLADVVFIAHPSNVAIPEDIEKVKKPISLAIGDKDFMLSPAKVETIGEVWGKLNGVDTEIANYPGAGHGFSIRADPLNEKQIEQSLEAETQAVAWFMKHFSALS